MYRIIDEEPEFETWKNGAMPPTPLGDQKATKCEVNCSYCNFDDEVTPCCKSTYEVQGTPGLDGLPGSGCDFSAEIPENDLGWAYSAKHGGYALVIKEKDTGNNWDTVPCKICKMDDAKLTCWDSGDSRILWRSSMSNVPCTNTGDYKKGFLFDGVVYCANAQNDMFVKKASTDNFSGTVNMQDSCPATPKKGDGCMCPDPN